MLYIIDYYPEGHQINLQKIQKGTQQSRMWIYYATTIRSDIQV